MHLKKKKKTYHQKLNTFVLKKMKWDHIPDQDYYFYTVKWTQPQDRHLILRLLYKKEEVYPTLPHKAPHVLVEVLEAFNDDHRTKHQLLDFTQRLEFLEQRFRTFKALTIMSGTQWDAEANFVNAVDEVWEKIFEDNLLAQAYLRAGEPEFNEMCMLFAPDEVKTELSHTVVLVSDTPESKNVASFILIDSSPDSEVNSSAPPPPPPPQHVVRKLFPEPDDAMSSCVPPRTITPHLYVPWPKLESRLRYPAFPKAPMFRKNDDEKEKTDKACLGGESSCASSSPHT